MIDADHGTEAFLRVAADRRRAEEWALVLVSEGMRASVRRARRAFVVSVPQADAQRAAAVLLAYDREARPQTEPASGSGGRGYLVAAAAVPILLTCISLVAWREGVRTDLFRAGSADSGAIVSGELWRTVTALTLHMTPTHLMANAFAIALFLGAVCRALGVGLGCAAVLLAGAGGNLLNAYFQGAPHSGAGASTAVFGAVGLLGGLGVARRFRGGGSRRRAWLPVAAGLALLAMLGTSGARVDVWAHFWGLVAGTALGLPIGLAVRRPPPDRLQWLTGGLALGGVVLAWGFALR